MGSKRKQRRNSPVPIGFNSEPAGNTGGASNVAATERRSRKSGQHARINVRLAVVTLATVIVLSGGIHLLHGYQVRRNAEVLLDRARAARAEGDAARALQEYSRYLGFRPADTDALAELALLLDQRADSGRAWLNVYLTFEEVLRRDPARDDIRRRLVEVALKLGRYTDATTHLAPLRKKFPDEASLAYQAAQCHLATENVTQAAADLREALAKDPGHAEYYAALAELVLKHGAKLPLKEIDPAQQEEPTAADVADRLMDLAIEKADRKVDAYVARSRFRQIHGNFAGAAGDLAQALEVDPKDRDVLIASAELALAQARDARTSNQAENVDTHLAVAADYIQRSLALTPPDLRAALLAAQIQLEKSDLPGALAAIRKGLEEVPRVRDEAPDQAATLGNVERQLQFTLADLLLTQISEATGNADIETALPEAEQLVEQLRQNGLASSLCEYLEARMLAAREQWRPALDRMLQARDSLRPFPEIVHRADLVIAECYTHLNRPADRVEALRRAVATDPLWARGHFELAGALAAEGRIEEALGQYQPLLANIGIPVIAARLQIQQQLRLPESRRDWAASQRMLDLGDAQGQKSPDAGLLRAEILIQQRQYAQAQKLLEQLQSRFPTQPSVWTALAGLALYRDDFSAAERIRSANTILDAARAQLGDVPELAVARVELSVRRAGDAGAAELTELQKEVAHYAPKIRAGLLGDIGRGFQRLGKTSDARAAWREAAAARPNDVRLRLILAEYALREKDEAELKSLTSEVARIEGSDGPCTNYLDAVAALERARENSKSKPDLTGIRAKLQSAARQRPKWSAVPEAQGYLEELARNHEESFEYFQRALELGSRARDVAVRVVRQLSERGRFEDADALLQKLSEEQPELVTGDLARLAWAVAWERQQYDRALGLARTVAGDRTNYRDLIWLAQLRFARGQKGPDVEEPLRQAIDVAPQAPEPWFALVAYFRRVDRVSDAAATILQAEKSLPREAASLLAARCYEFLNDRTRAEEKYRAAFAAQPDDPDTLISVCDFYTRIGNLPEAQKYLNRVLESKNAPAALTWGRRRKALLLAATGSYADVTAALQELEQSGRKGEEVSLADLRARVAILERRPTYQDRTAAIQVYGEIAARQRLLPDEQLRLAQLHEAVGNWDAARNIFGELAEAHRADATYVAANATALCRHGEAPAAARWVSLLQELQPDAFGTAVVLARYTASGGSPEDISQVFARYFEQHPVSAVDVPLRRLVSAKEQKLDELRTMLTADSNDGAAELLQARDLLKQNKSEEAWKLLRRFVQTSEQAAATRAVELEQAAVLCEEWGDAAAAEMFYREYADAVGTPNATFALVRFYSRQGRRSEALQLCQDLSSRTDPLSLAMAGVSVVSHGQATPDELDTVNLWAQAAIQMEPNKAGSLICLADLHVLQGDYSVGRSLYQQVLGSDPDNVVAMNNLAWLLAATQQDVNQAAELMAKAIEVAGPISDLLDTRALIQLNRKQPTLALRDLHDAMAEKAYTVGWIRLAEVHLEIGDRKAAEDALAQAGATKVQISVLHPLERRQYENARRRLSSK